MPIEQTRADHIHQPEKVVRREPGLPVSVVLDSDLNLIEEITQFFLQENLNHGDSAPVLLHISNPQLINPIHYDGTQFTYDTDQVDWPENNFNHYAPYFALSEQWNEMTKVFQDRPDSKRLMFSFWKPENLTTEKAPSLVSIQFRLQEEKLAMFVVMNSNRFNDKFFLNYQMLSAVHTFAAEKFGVPKGSYNHFVTAMQI